MQNRETGSLINGVATMAIEEHYDVCVIGGGPIGLTAALAMANRGFSVALVDGGALSVEAASIGVPRAYALNLHSQQLLEHLMVWERIAPNQLSPYRKMEVWDTANESRLDFDSRMIVTSALGHIIEESTLRAAALSAVTDYPNLRLFPNQTVTHISSLGDTVVLSSGDRKWRASLLMVADGAQSPSRTLLQIPMTQWSYHQSAIVASVAMERPHQQTAYQVFYPREVLAFLPLPKQSECSIVWSMPPSRAAQLVSCSEQVFNTALTQTLQSRLGQVRLTSARCCFPLTMRHVQRYSDSSWMVLGDAAHTIHPFVGWGLNLGFSDLQVWLDCFDRVGGKLQRKSRALAAYQRERKHTLWQIIAMLEGLKMIYFNRLPPLTMLRGLGVKLCNELLPIKQALITYAAML